MIHSSWGSSRDCRIQMLTIANAISGFNFYFYFYFGRSTAISQDQSNDSQRSIACTWLTSARRSLTNHDKPALNVTHADLIGAHWYCGVKIVKMPTIFIELEYQKPKRSPKIEQSGKEVSEFQYFLYTFGWSRWSLMRFDIETGSFCI